MQLDEFLKSNHKTHLIFDLDLTLVFLQIDWSTFRKGVWDIVAELDASLTREVPNVSGNGMIMINRAVQKHGVRAKEMFVCYVERYEYGNFHGYLPNADLIRFVHKNHDKYTLSLWTNNCRKVVTIPLVKEQLLPCFDSVITRDDIMLLKPEPDGFNAIFDKTCDKSGYLMIGDSIWDKEASKKAGIDFFLIDYFS